MTGQKNICNFREIWYSPPLIHIKDSHFESNNGSAGSAFSMALYDRHIESTIFPDMIVFRNCSFLNNSAVNEGTAVGLFSLIHVDQVGFPVYFHDWYVCYYHRQSQCGHFVVALSDHLLVDLF